MSKKYTTYIGHTDGRTKKYDTYYMPYFAINGYEFRIKKDTESKSELNIVKTKMYVPTTSWGYNQIDFVNFTGEEIDLEIYSRVTEKYTGDKVQPETGALQGFYSNNPTPHATLKYWAQCGVVCTVLTNLQAYESGDYIITDFSQSSPEFDTVTTKLTLSQYEDTSDIQQTFWRTSDTAGKSTTASELGEQSSGSGVTVTDDSGNSQVLSASAQEIMSLGDHHQTCKCTEDTPLEECTSTVDQEVRVIQKYLQQFGYFPTYTKSNGLLEVSGKYCWYTTQGVANLQEANNLPATGEFNSGVRDVLLKLIGVNDSSLVSTNTVVTKTNTG